MGNSALKLPQTGSSPHLRTSSPYKDDLTAITLPTTAGVFAPSKRVETLAISPSVPLPDPRETSVVFIQALVRRYLMERMFERALRKQSVANELLQTETNYVANLTVLIDVFAKPLQDSCNMAQRASDSVGNSGAMQPIIPESQIRTLFSSAEILLQFQEVFLKELRQKVEHWHYEQTIGSILTKMTPFMRLYAEYVGNFTEATELYHRLISKRDGNARFKAFVECAYQSPSVLAVGELDSFLVQPVQRLPRYKMFLEQLIKLTSPEHEDLIPLQVALKKVSDVLYYVNEKKRSHDLQLQVFIAYGKIEPPIEDLVSPGRALLLEGPLYWTKSLKENRLLCQAFLFSDLLIITKVSKSDKKRYKFLARFDLRTLNIGTIQYHKPDAHTHSKSDSLQGSKGDSKLNEARSSASLGGSHSSLGSSSSSLASSSSQLKNSSSSAFTSLNISSASLANSGGNASGPSTVLAREPCFYLESRFNNQFVAWCWQDENQAYQWREALENAAEKVHLGRETNPSTSEGKAQAFKSSVSRHYVSSSSPLDTSSPSSQSQSHPQPESSSTAQGSTLSSQHLKTASLPSTSSSTAPSLSSTQPSAPTDASAHSETTQPPQRQLRKFAERRRQLGI